MAALRAAGIGARLAAVLVAVALLAASSYAAVPIGPVPISLQTLAVTLVGAVLGARLGVLATLLWLALGAAGLAVLANGTAGLARFAGPTGGYLFAFPLAAGLVGWLSARGWSARLPLALGEMLAGNALCLLLGTMWLAARMGWVPAIGAGFLPFLPGALVKALVGAAVVRAIGGRLPIRPSSRA